MKTVLLLVALAPAVLGQEKSFPLLDKFHDKSPLHNSGSCKLAETPIPGGYAIADRADWHVTNISSKPIVAVVEDLQIVSGEREIVEHRNSYDAYFHPDLLKPQQTIEFYGADDPTMSSYQSAEPQPPSSGASCEAVMRWVQFEDGTWVGDPQYAQSLLSHGRQSKAPSGFALRITEAIHRQAAEPAQPRFPWLRFSIGVAACVLMALFGMKIVMRCAPVLSTLKETFAPVVELTPNLAWAFAAVLGG